MARWPILKGFLNSPSYRTPNSQIKVKHEESDDGLVPEELIFYGENGQKSHYRFMSPDLIPEQAKFTGASWDIEIEPVRSNVLEFCQFSTILSSFEKYFLATTQDGHLKFFIGDEDATTDRSSVVMAENVEGQLKGDLYFETAMVASLLKMGIPENLKMKITSKGAMQIEMNSAYATYRFLIPARHR